ncbi:MAG TPA: ABC transporter permease [Candidatus Limnocylindrales bacterium]|nr:ABC transporter permease [Candidatus Limnocylindrales bacterium]
MTLGPINLDWIVNNRGRIGELLVEHVWLTLIAVGIGLVISFALALLIRERPRLYGPIIGVTGTLYAIPSLALFALLTPITGLGTLLTAQIALVSYTLLILTRNIVEGLRAVPVDAIESAQGMGYTPAQRLLRVELPLALPIIVAGLRIATVTIVGLVTVTALIGMGGLGYLIVTIGINRGSFGLTAALTGIVLAVGLAILADIGLLALQRALTPWARRRAA